MWHHSSPSDSGHSCLICLPPSRFPPLSAYLPPPAARAPVEGAYYIVAVSGGTVLSKQAGGVQGRDAVNSDTQRWRVEYGDDDHDNHVAVKNVSDGRWLRALSGGPRGEVVTANEKQWWTIEEGSSPGSCWLKCNDFDDAYLCNADGSHLDGNAVYTASKQAENAHAFTWNLRDADAVGYNTKGWQLNNNVQGSLRAEEIEQGRRELIEKERALNAKQSELLRKEESLAAQELALKKQMEELTTEESDLQQKALTNGNSSTALALLKAENDSLHLQLRTSSLEREVEKVKDRAVSSHKAEQLRSLEAETGRLKAIVQAHERSARSSPSPTKLRDTNSVFNSPSPSTTRTTHSRQGSLSNLDGFSLRSPPANLLTLGGKIPSLTATTASPPRKSSRDSLNTPTRPSTANLSLASDTPRSYDSRFSGWPEDDCTAPITPIRASKRAVSSPMNFTSPRNHDKSRLSTNETLSPGSAISESVRSNAKKTGLGISTSSDHTLSSTCTSKSTPAKGRSSYATLQDSVASPGTTHLSEDGDAVVHPCGHKIYKPPRKLNRTVAGYLYE